MVDLIGLYRVTAKGRTYWYAWRNGPRIVADPADAAAFAAEFAQHHAARKGGDPGLLSGLIVDWKKSDAWTLPADKGGMADSTKKNWKGPLDEIARYWGGLKLAAFEDAKGARKRIKKWRAKWAAQPRTADMHKQVLSALLSFAVEEDRLETNPCIGMSNLYDADRADIIWTEDDVMRLAGHASPEVMFAFGLACMTGLRQTDLLRLSWSHVSDLAIEFKTGKSRVRGSGQRTAVIPMYDGLRALLAAIPKRATTVLTNSDGLPWKSGFTSSWNKAVKPAGIDKHFHDTRGSFVTWAYELDVFSVKELAEMLAWSEDKVERIINRYVRRDALLRDKIRRFDEAKKTGAGDGGRTHDT